MVWTKVSLVHHAELGVKESGGRQKFSFHSRMTIHQIVQQPDVVITIGSGIHKTSMKGGVAFVANSAGQSTGKLHHGETLRVGTVTCSLAVRNVCLNLACTSHSTGVKLST